MHPYNIVNYSMPVRYENSLHMTLGVGGKGEKGGGGNVSSAWTITLSV